MVWHSEKKKKKNDGEVETEKKLTTPDFQKKKGEQGARAQTVVLLPFIPDLLCLA